MGRAVPRMYTRTKQHICTVERTVCSNSTQHPRLLAATSMKMPKLKMKPAVCLFVCAATLLLLANAVNGLSRVPKWVHDMRVQRVAELKEQIARASQVGVTMAILCSNHGARQPRRMKARLARLTPWTFPA